MPQLSAEKPRRAKRPAAQSPAKSPDREVKFITLGVLNRDEMIAVAAYYRAESRRFEPGHELEDWLAAESEIDRALINQPGGEATV